MKKFFVIFVIVTAAMAATAPEAGARQYGRRVERCASRFDWRRVGQRPELVRCVGRVFKTPGGGGEALSVGFCESGSDLQDIDGADGHIGTFQHITSAWDSRWASLGRPTGVPSSPTNVLSQAVVSVRMAKRDGTWSQQWTCA